jgi:integrase
MPSYNLTTRTVETLKPGAKRQELADRHLTGLFLIVQPNGRKSWAVRYRVSGGRNRKLTLGAYPAIDLKTARDLASKALREVAEGKDPGLEKLTARHDRADTFEAVARQFVELHCKRVNRPNSISSTQGTLRRDVLPYWGKRPLKDITRRDVRDLLDGIMADERPAMANRALIVVRKLFNWAIERDIVTVSPCAGIKKPSAERSRDRTLDDNELRDVWLAADQVSGPYEALIKLLMLTGQRRNEVSEMAWGEVDLDARLWTLPKERSKNGKAHSVPLSEPAIAILQALPRRGDLVLMPSGGNKSTRDFARNKRRLDALLPADMAHWTQHDLRRSMVSGMARLGVSLPVIEKIVNHSSGSFSGIVGVYQRHDYLKEKTAALELWGRHVLSLTRPPEERSNVIEFGARA